MTAARPNRPARISWRYRPRSSPWTGPLKTNRGRDATPSGIVAAPWIAKFSLALRCVGASGVDIERPCGALHNFPGDHHLLDAFEARQVEHGVEQDALHDRAQPPRAGLAVDRLAGDGAERLICQGQIDALHLEQALVLLHQRVLRLREDALEGQLVEILEGGQHGQPPDEFGDEAVLQQILRCDLAEDFAGAPAFRRDYLGAEADRARSAARRDDLLEPGEGAAAYEQNIGGVDLQEFLLRMLAAALRRYRRDGAFHDLQQRLLNSFSRNIAGDREVLRLAADLVDFINVDDTALGALDIVVGRLQQLEDDVLDVLADIAGFRQRGRISHGERYVQNARERLREQRFARPGRADQQDVGLREFDVFLFGLMV